MEGTIDGVVEGIEAFKELLPLQLQKCLDFFPGVDRTVVGFDGIMAAQECLPTNEKRDQFAATFGVLNKLWTAISPDGFLSPYRADYKWLAQIYESVRPIGQTGALVWAALGSETIKMIHENTDIKGIRDDIDEGLAYPIEISGEVQDAEIKSLKENNREAGTFFNDINDEAF